MISRPELSKLGARVLEARWMMFRIEESPQILHRKMFLRGYLNKLCSDPTKMEFWEYLDKVG